MKLTLDSINALKTQGQQLLGRLSHAADELRNGNVPNLGGTDFGGTSKSKSTFSVQSFMSNMVANDLALTSHFMVTLNHPSAPKFAQFAAYSTTLPGYTVNTMEVRRYGVGPTYSYPVSNVNPEYTINFYIDAGGEILYFFQSWANRVFNMQVSDAPDSPPHYVANYKSEYAIDVDIDLFNRQKDTYFRYRLHNMYPTLIGNAELQWGDSNIFRLPVSFKYDSYETAQMGVTTKKIDNTQGNGLLNDVRSAFDEAGNVLGQVRGIQSFVQSASTQIRNLDLNNIFPRG